MVYYIVTSMLLLASAVDIVCKKIPNLLILIYLFIGVFFFKSDFLIRFSASTVILAFFYGLRFFGAGDVKLFSLLIGFLGVYEAFGVCMLSLSLAAAYSLVYMIFTGQFFNRLSYFFNYCMRFLISKRPERYIDFNSRDKALIPISPYVLAGFLLWRYTFVK